ncbi:hypothetical protein [Streptomyces scabiei]|uniref:hypothetical protein n=1 Tax=Streptomyces scabiei TaxID=1930 RepID=UPI001B343F3A|nr:hypothetical protein [Streptomyces sp. LBUM 1481]MBP5896389.1 hypothetical protein [Streptomyces sp. LBUM 1481]
MFPGFNDSTLAIIDVLQSRMDFDTGHARYALKDVIERTGLKRAAVTKHVAMIRRAGWLAWVEHGSLRNALRGLGRPGYARTATVYAATIPRSSTPWSATSWWAPVTWPGSSPSLPTRAPTRLWKPLWMPLWIPPVRSLWKTSAPRPRGPLPVGLFL